jgi:hypothetical protein
MAHATTNDQNYQLVVKAITEKGKPNPAFPKDRDISYGELTKLVKFGGLPAVLKSMKKKVGNFSLAIFSNERRKWLILWIKDFSKITL